MSERIDSDRFPSTSEDRRSAYFAAGQAVMALREGLDVELMSIDPLDKATAWVDVSEPLLTGTDAHIRANTFKIVRSVLAGPAAQEAYSFGRLVTDLDLTEEQYLGESSIWRALDLLGAIKELGAPLLPTLWRGVQATLYADDVWKTVEAVAGALLRDRELAGFEVAEIVRTYSRSR